MSANAHLHSYTAEAAFEALPATQQALVRSQARKPIGNKDKGKGNQDNGKARNKPVQTPQLK